MQLRICFILFLSFLTNQNWFSASWWSGNEKYFCFLFIASGALLQSHAEFNRLYKETFLHAIPVRITATCYKSANVIL